MAGFFGFFDYTKEGPGVDKDAPPKAKILLFFEVFFRKFWKLIRLNIMFLIFNIPALAAMFIATHFIFQNALTPDDMLSDLYLRFSLGAFLVCVPVITIGPAQAGFTYVLRNFSREEHAFLWWDFKDAAKQNFKESMIISFIDFLMVILFGIAINFYGSYEGATVLTSIASGFLLLAFVIFLMMHIYIYPMLVTFKLTVKQIYKNALIFSLAKFLPNLGILLLVFLLIQASFLFYPVIGIILFIFITVSFMGYTTNFYAYPKLKKYIIDKIEEEDDEEYEEDDDDEGEKDS